MNYDLLQKILKELEYGLQHYYRHRNSELIEQIKEELNKPELIDVGYIEPKNNVLFNKWNLDNITDGKYKLLALKID